MEPPNKAIQGMSLKCVLRLEVNLSVVHTNTLALSIQGVL